MPQFQSKTKSNSQSRIRIAFIDDEPRVLRTLSMLFKRQYTVYTTTDPDEFLQIIEREHIHVAVSDQRMPKMQGVALLQQVKQRSPQTVRLLLTGYADISAIVASLNQGEIYRYLTKPWKTDELSDTIARAVEHALALTRQSEAELHDTSELPQRHPAASSLVKNPLANSVGRILLLDSEGVAYSQLQAQATNKYHVKHCQSLATVKDVLADLTDVTTPSFEVAVVAVSSSPESQSHAEQFLRLIQTESPDTVSIALTAAQDSHWLIHLINERYLYRCLPMPVSPVVLDANITQAFAQYKRQINQPKLEFMAPLDKLNK